MYLEVKETSMDIWNSFRNWGVFAHTEEKWPEYKEHSESEILAALPMLCARRGELFRKRVEMRRAPYKSDVFEKLESDIFVAALGEDIKIVRELCLKKKAFQSNWEEDVKKQNAEESECDKEFARVSDHIQVLLNRLSGLPGQ